MTKIIAYERDDGKYVVGISAGIKNGIYLFRKGCVIDGKEVDRIKSVGLEAALKVLYLGVEEKGDRQIPRNRVVKPQPITINLSED